MRRLLVLGLLGAMLNGVLLGPASTAEPSFAQEAIPAPGDAGFASDGDPLDRAKAWLPRDPGTKRWITLDYGPYLIHPGSDLSRMDVEIVGADGYAIGFRPSVIDAATGEEASTHDIHIHHAHWYWLDPDQPGYHRWIYGTGEEQTQGTLTPAMKAEPGYRDGLRYGIRMQRGDRLGFLSMLHNKTAQAKLVYLRVRIQFVYGSPEDIRDAKGWRFRNLTPVLIGSTFNVPRTGGIFTYPLDVSKKTIGAHTNYHNPVQDVEVVPGLGQVMKVPWDATIVIGAGHSHPGAREVVLSNLGTTNDPCPDDADRFPGLTLARSRNITRGGVFPSEEFQMGLTQPGWRVHVRKGDRLVLNGVYDSTDYAYPDAMSYFGMYIDTSDKTSASEACRVELIDRPRASHDEVTHTVPNQKWAHHAHETCDRCDVPGPKPERGPRTNTVHIVGHQYLPGNLGLEGEPLGPPVVERGERLLFINEDYAEGAVRHSITSCRAPCNGAYFANYPFHDGVFHSGALGYAWQETYVSAKDEPRWELDTSDLRKGYYTFYCQLHPWMRGSFYVE